MAAQTIELRFPTGGVQRRISSKAGSDTSPPTAAWACNVRTEDALDRRLRGGSRSGLTKFIGTNYGTISDIASLLINSGGSVLEKLVILATSGFLATGQQLAFVINSGSLSSLNPSTGVTTSMTISAGTLPTGCTFGTVYRDRLFLSGGNNSIYASRLGVYSDWALGVDVSDTRRAVAFQLSLSSDVGAKPTAIIPHKDTFLICATERSLWVVRGDPAAGELTRISENVGIISSHAWCRADNSIVFLSRDGLYSVNADGSGLTPLSTQAVPDELRNINTASVSVSIGYDQERSAIHVFLRTAAGNDTHWIYEPQTQSFWPVVLPSGQSPKCVCRHGGELLLAGGDGYIRKIGGTTDDGTNVQSHVLIGPIRLGELNQYGLVNTLHGILGNDSGNVNWRIVTGESADLAADNGKAAIQAFQSGGNFTTYVRASGVWNGNRSLTTRPRVRGMWACIWLQSTAMWALEGLTMEVGETGNWRG